MANFLKTFILDKDRVIVKQLRKKSKYKFIFIRNGYEPIFSNKSKWSNKELLAAFNLRKTEING